MRDRFLIKIGYNIIINLIQIFIEDNKYNATSCKKFIALLITLPNSNSLSQSSKATATNVSLHL